MSDLRKLKAGNLTNGLTLSTPWAHPQKYNYIFKNQQ